MQSRNTNTLNTFAEEVGKGLSSAPKTLSSKYFYDDEGSRLFQAIMQLPEYYLTRAEYEIFESQRPDIYAALAESNMGFDLIELGAGDGAKTAVLIEYFLTQAADFTYAPIDISQEAIDSLTHNFAAKFPRLSIEAQTGDYFQILETLKSHTQRRKVVLFLGSNIGNFTCAQAIDFFRRVRASLNADDLLFVGFDLQKDPQVILSAYDDIQGVTAKFNLNLLARINRELGGNFKLENFSHYAIYHPIECAARSFLVSRTAQDITISALNRSFHFQPWEPIFMEISQKYNLPMIEELARASGFEMTHNFFDKASYFVDSLWKLR